MRTIRWLAALACCLPLATGAADIKVGETVPDVSLPALVELGETYSLDSLRGKVVYVDFWASWCGPCRLSFPVLDKLRAEYGDRGFEVLAINVDEDREDALDFLQKFPATYLVAHDPEGETPQTFGIIGMPTGFLVDREGKVRMVHEGFRRSDEAVLREEILELLEDAR